MSNSITTTLTKIRGFSLDILKALKKGPKSSSELCLELGVKGNYIRSYLHNLKKYGLVTKNEIFWKIVPDKINTINKIIDIENIYKAKESKRISERKSKTKTNGERILEKERLKEAFEHFLKQQKYEVVVVNVAKRLFEHYLETGAKFVIFGTPEDIESFFGLYRKDIARAISMLTNERVAYMWKSSGELKIALYKDFIERLKDWKTDFVKKQEVEKK